MDQGRAGINDRTFITLAVLKELSPNTTVRGKSNCLVATYRPVWSGSERRSPGMAAVAQNASSQDGFSDQSGHCEEDSAGPLLASSPSAAFEAAGSWGCPFDVGAAASPVGIRIFVSYGKALT